MTKQHGIRTCLYKVINVQYSAGIIDILSTDYSNNCWLWFALSVSWFNNCKKFSLTNLQWLVGLNLLFLESFNRGLWL